MTNLAKAIIEVMKEVKGVEKGLNVGTGKSSYKGVSDKDVKLTVGRAMAKHGLCILPISITPHVTIHRWEEEDSYSNSNPKPMKPKQQVFTEVETKYLLLHESGESMEISGYGHGVDSQDKSAGKATTYALKYALLYSFLVPTGDIDDSDNEHSEEKNAPKSTAKSTSTAKNNGNLSEADERPWLNKGDANWNKVVTALKGNYTLPQVLTKYKVSKPNQEFLLEEAAQ